MAAIADADISVATGGDIRWTGAATTNRHTVLELIQFFQDKSDDAEVTDPDSIIDITVDTAYDRSTDQILTLNSPYNIDDTFASHFYDGSISQTDQGGETIYSGLNIIGPVETGTEYMIIQDGKILPAFWGTGINPEAAPSLVFSRHLVKTKFAGAQIDGQRVTVLARELGDQYRRFPATLGTGNSVAAIGNGADIFNTTADATIAGWTTIVNTEGFQDLDIDGTGAVQEFYSQWDTGSQTVNDVYERSKWISQRSHIADATSGAVSGTNYVVDNATILGQAQSFIPLSGTEYLTEARWQIKNGSGTPTGTLYCELYDSDDASPGVPTGAVLARSEPVLASAITSTYEEVIFRFNNINPNTGAFQNTGLSLGNAEYYIALKNDEGDASNFFHVEGSATSVDATQDRAELTGAWAGSATTDLNLTVKSAPPIHGIPGEQFQGINIEVGYDGEIGTGVPENSIALWGTKITYDALVSGPFLPGEYIQINVQATSAVRAGGKILYDDGVDEIVVALDTLSVVVDNDTFTTVRGAAETTATVNVTLVDNDKSGGTGLVLAKDDNGTTGEVYLQVLSGSNPVDNNIIRRDDVGGDPLADSLVATATLNTRTLIPEYLGTSTGSNIIGAYGIGFVPADVGSSDRFIDLSNTQRIPPNNVIFTVSGMVSGDRCLVGPRTTTSLDRGQWLLSTALTSTVETEVVVKTGGTDTVPWPSNEINWPSAGAPNSAIRVQMDDGRYRRLVYTSHDSSARFAMATASFSGDEAAVNNNVFMGFIDLASSGATLTFTGVHGGVDRDLFVRVRDGGATPIKTFENVSAQFLSTAQTVAASRITDA